jgi:membrane protein YdbS with pleckstrin-like domain
VVPISRDLLDDDEDLLIDVHPHWLLLLVPGLATAAAAALALFLVARFPHAPDPVGWFLVLLVAIPAAWLAARLAQWWSTSLVVTTSRLVLRRGLFGRDVLQLRLQRIDEVHCVQTLPERLFGAGRLLIEVTGEDSMVTVDDVRRAPALQRVLTNRLDQLAHPADRAEWVTPSVPVGASHPPPTRRLVRPETGLGDVPGAHPTPPAGTPPAGLGAPTPLQGPADVHRQLIALDDLRRRGIVTEAEFAAKKAELLGRL